jgi:Ca2+-binding RTX toxin-like protein
VLGRAPDAEGLAFWVKEYSAATSQGAFFSKLISNVVNYNGTDAAGVTSKSLFANKVAVAQYYGEQNGTVAGATAALNGVTSAAASVDAAKAVILNTAVSGQTFTLTTSLDSGAAFSGTNGSDTFSALTTTLTTGDNIVGAGGTDNLNLSGTIAASAAIAGFTLGSIENVNVSLSDGDATTAHTLTLNMLNAGVVGVTLSGLAATTRADILTLDNLAAGSTIGLSGATNLNLTANYVAAATAGTADSVSLALNSTTSTAATDGIVTIGTGFETLNISVSGGAAALDDIITSTATTVNVSGNQNLTVRQTLDATLDVLNASAFTGRLNIVTANDTSTPDALVGVVDVVDDSITGGTGNDTIDVSANAADNELFVNGGAGDDTVIIGAVLGNASSTSAGDVLQGGDGIDTLQADIDLIDAAAVTTALTGVTAFETVNLSGAFDDASTLNVANISSNVNRVNISTVGGAANHVINYSAGAQTLGINVAAAVAAGQTLTLDAAGTATTDALTIANMLTTGQMMSATSNLTITDFETVTINTGSYTTAAAQLSAAINLGTNALVLSGSNGLTTTTTTGVITAGSINASGMTGALTMNAAAASGVTTITGGSSGDTLLGDASATIDGGAGNDSITGGTGNDNLQGGLGDDTITTNTGTDNVSGGDGADTLIFGDNLSSLDTVSGGADADTISLTNTSLGTLAGLTISEANTFNTNFTSVETLRLTNALDRTTFDLGYMLALTSARLDAGITGAETLNGFDSGETLDLRAALGNTLTVGVNNASTGTSDAFTVRLGASAGVDYTDLAIANVETLTINNTEATASATVRANTIGLTITQATGGAAQSVIINGTESLTVDTAIAAGTINASGMTTAAATDAGLAMSSSLTATTAITGQTITGSGKVDTLYGSTGADSINAGAGADVIHGATGADTIDGGDGTDTYQTTGLVGGTIEGAGTGTSTGVVINLGSTEVAGATIIANGGQSLSGPLTGVAAGQIAYVFNGSLNTNSSVIKRISNVENITLAANGINFVVGSDAANNVLGGTGVDYISGGAGNDVLNGGTGAVIDTILGGTGDDSITGDAGVDVLTGGDGNDIYVFAAEADLFTNNLVVDSITESATGGTDTIQVSGVAASFTIAAADDFGARAVNIESITAVASDNAISISLKADAGTDAVALRTIDLSGDTSTTGTNVVDLSLSTGAYTVIGSAGVDQITTSLGVDEITGGGGTDAITAGGVLGTGVATAAASTSTATLDKIFLGALGDNDTINLATNLLGGTDNNYDAFTTNNTGAAISLTVVSGAGAGGSVGLVTGIYDATAQTFTAAAHGAATNAILISTAATDATTATDSIVLVGAYGLLSTDLAIANGIITV